MPTENPHLPDDYADVLVATTRSPLWEKAMHGIAGDVADGLWWLAGRAWAISERFEQAHDVLGSAGHKVLDAACAVSERKLGADRD